MNEMRDEELFACLGAYGADLSRWPAEARARARAALLGRPDFRRAWEKEQELDLAIGQARAGLDSAISVSRAAERVKQRTLRLSNPLAGLRWQRVAAAVLAAGMLGGAADLLLPDDASEPSDAVIVDPLLGLDGSDA